MIRATTLVLIFATLAPLCAVAQLHEGFYDVELSVVHFPESDVLHLGDVFRTTSYPIIDVYNGGTLSGTIEALDLAISLTGPETKIIPGHGSMWSDVKSSSSSAT